MHAGYLGLSTVAKHCGCDGGVWCQGLLCVPAVCLSLSKCVQGAVLQCLLSDSPPSTHTHTRECDLDSWARSATSELVYCSPDEAKVHEDGGFG